jgi:FKBP-type peptidyl-prolyl cis-trans isomerase FklB
MMNEPQQPTTLGASRKWFGCAKLSPVLLACALAAPTSAQEAPKLETPRDRVNYAIGVNMISNLRQQGIEVDLDLVIRGMQDAHAGGTLLLSDEEVRIAIQKYQNEVRKSRSQSIARLATENKREGEAFQAANKSVAGVVTLPSGLQYQVLKAGTGRKPVDKDTVEVRFTGTFVNGREFDATSRTGKPLVLKVGAAIPGWREALKLMPEGSTWKLVVPPRLAYGDRGKPGQVGPYATLVYELELVGIR